MDFNAETLVQASGEILRPQRRLFACEPLEEVDDFPAKLVPLFRPWLLGHQAHQTLFVEALLGGIERRPGQTEIRGRTAYRLTLHADPAQHFVLELHQVLRIEELMAREQLIPHLLRVAVETAVLAQDCAFVTGSRVLRHLGLLQRVAGRVVTIIMPGRVAGVKDIAPGR
jgi:hypothetical protein